MNSIKQAIKEIAKPFYKRLKVYLNHYNDPLYPLYREWYITHSKRLLKFKDIHAGESCFIIGNGPSLNKMDLSLLKDYHTFGLNKIYLMFDKVDLNLSYHVAVNKLVIEQSIKEFKKINIPLFLSFRVAKENGIDSNKSIYYILTEYGPDGFQRDITQPIYEGATVTYVALQIAFFMGFNKVFLIGVDHNFSCAGDPNEKKFLKGNDPNHFDPNYFSDKEWHLPDLVASELSFNLANFNFNRCNRKIYDATINGKLNIFTKINYEQALCEAKKASCNS